MRNPEEGYESPTEPVGAELVDMGTAKPKTPENAASPAKEDPIVHTKEELEKMLQDASTGSNYE